MKNKQTLENLKNQLKKVIKEHPICVNEDTYWRGVKIGLETAIEYVKLQEQDNNMYNETDMTGYALYILKNDKVISPKEWKETIKQD